MKISPTKHDGPPIKYNFPLHFTKMNSTVQEFMSCENIFTSQDLKGAKRQDHPLIRPGLEGM